MRALRRAGPEIKAGRPFEHAMETERHLATSALTSAARKRGGLLEPRREEAIFQAHPAGRDATRSMPRFGERDVKMVSTAKAAPRAAISIIPGEADPFSSTHAARDSCPPPPDRSHGYVWAIYDSMTSTKASGRIRATPLIRSPATTRRRPGAPRRDSCSPRLGTVTWDLYVREDAGR